jgi:Mrp family chromosome partitioning ATPase
MRGGRRKLPVLAEIAGPAPGPARTWALRRGDLEPLARLQGALADHLLVLVVGERRLEGAAALAGAASAAGRRTALVECDLAQPRLAAAFGLAAAPGLHEYLRWEATASEILQPLALAGPAARGATQPLICVAGGRPAANPATLTGLESFRHALAKLRGAYDLTVLAGPELGPDAGPLAAIAARADTLLAAVPPAAVAAGSGRELRALLKRLPVEVRGAIVVGASSAPATAPDAS